MNFQLNLNSSNEYISITLRRKILSNNNYLTISNRRNKLNININTLGVILSQIPSIQDIENILYNFNIQQKIYLKK